MKNHQIENLVLEGGGTCGIAFVGAIQELEKLDKLSNIKNYAGSSAGSIVSFLMALGLNGSDIETLIRELDFRLLKDDSFGVIRDLFRFVTKFGIYEGKAFEVWMKKVLKQLGHSENLTLDQLYRHTGKSLFITATNVNLGKTVIFQQSTHPTLPVWKAIRMSMSIPLFFVPVIYDDHRYIDGGVLDNYPIRIFDHTDPNPKTLGLRLDASDEINHTIIYSDSNLFQYINSLFNMVYNKMQDDLISEEDWDRTIRINTGNISGFDFNIDHDKVEFLINSGRLAVNEYLNRK